MSADVFLSTPPAFSVLRTQGHHLVPSLDSGQNTGASQKLTFEHLCKFRLSETKQPLI